MNVKSCEKKEKSTYGLVVEVTPEEFNIAIDSAYKKNRGQIAVPGFRKGKAPRKIVENMYGSNIFYEDALDAILPAVFSHGVTENNLEAVGNPDLDDIQIGEDKTVTVTFTIAVYPTVTIGEYKEIKAVKPLVEVTESDIETAVEKVRFDNARIETVTGRPVIGGDTVTLDYSGTREGVAFEGGTAENYELKIGSNTFIPGFEEKLQGMFTDEERDIDLTFPTEYHSEELAGKDVVFHVKINEIKSQVLPELDDEFAKDVSEFDTLAEYRDSVAAEIKITKEAEAVREFENNVMDKLVATVEGEIPDALVNQYIENNVQNMRQSLSQYGMELEMYLNMMNTTFEAFTENMRPNAELNAKSTLALEQVAQAEKFEPTEEEMEVGYTEMAENFSMDVDAVKEQVSKDMLVRELNMRKATRFVMDSAIAEEPVAEEPAEVAEETVEEAEKAE